MDTLLFYLDQCIRSRLKYNQENTQGWRCLLQDKPVCKLDDSSCKKSVIKDQHLWKLKFKERKISSYLTLLTSVLVKTWPIGSSISASTRTDLARLEICKTKCTRLKFRNPFLNNKENYYHLTRDIYQNDNGAKKTYMVTKKQIKAKNLISSRLKFSNSESLAFPGFRDNRASNALSYPAFCAAATSASFSTLIKLSFSSKASATCNKIFFLSSEGRACKHFFYHLHSNLLIITRVLR